MPQIAIELRKRAAELRRKADLVEREIMPLTPLHIAAIESCRRAAKECEDVAASYEHVPFPMISRFFR